MSSFKESYVRYTNFYRNQEKSTKTPKREKTKSGPKTPPKTPFSTPREKHQKRGQKHQIWATEDI